MSNFFIYRITMPDGTILDRPTGPDLGDNAQAIVHQFNGTWMVHCMANANMTLEERGFSPGGPDFRLVPAVKVPQ